MANLIILVVVAAVVIFFSALLIKMHKQDFQKIERSITGSEEFEP